MSQPIYTMPAGAAMFVARAAYETVRTYAYVALGEPKPKWEQRSRDWRAEQEDCANRVLSGELESPQAQHEAWLTRRIKQGWRYGSHLDVAAREHPSLVSWDQLSPAQRVKASLWRAAILETVRALLELEAATEIADRAAAKLEQERAPEPPKVIPGDIVILREPGVQAGRAMRFALVVQLYPDQRIDALILGATGTVPISGVPHASKVAELVSVQFYWMRKGEQ